MSKQTLPPDAEPEDDEKRRKLRDSTNSYMKYSGLAIQMGVIILVGVYAGKALDERLDTAPYLTVGFALLSIFAALYLSLKDLFTSTKK